MPPGTPAVTQQYINNGIITSSPMHFNTGIDPYTKQVYINWTTSCPVGNGQLKVGTIAFHEFGHVAGLGDLYACQGNSCFTPWNPPDSIMGSYYGPDGCNRSLGQDDADGLAQLYGQRYFFPAVYSNYNGWSSVILVMEGTPGSPYNTGVFLRFDPGTIYNIQSRRKPPRWRGRDLSRGDHKPEPAVQL